MWAAFEKNVWLVVDFYVYKSIYTLEWTNAKNAEEATY